MRPIKVMHILSDFNIGGAQQVVLDIVRNLDRDRFQPHVCLLRSGGSLIPRLEEERIPHHLCYFSSRMSIFGLYHLRTLLQELGIDIVHTHLRRSNISGRLAAVLAGTKVIIAHAHDTMHSTRVHHGMVERWLAKHTDSFICISDAVAEAQMEATHLPRNFFTTLHNFINPDDYRIDQSPQLAKADLGIPVGSQCVGIVGRLHPVKRHDLFLDTAFRLNQERPSIHFVIAGDGPEKESLREKARTLGMMHKVSFIGFTHQPSRVYKALDCLMVCSDSEGFGRVILEAQAAGVPVVARDVGGVSEALSGGGGLLVEDATPHALSNAIMAALGPKTRALLRQQMEKNLVRFDAGRQITQLEDIYEETCRLKGVTSL